METATLTLIQGFVKVAEGFAYSSENGYDVLRTASATYTIDDDGRVEMSESYFVSGPNRCGDYPAPCNCDDPDLHNGH
jgi:hypothetical protein